MSTGICKHLGSKIHMPRCTSITVGCTVPNKMNMSPMEFNLLPLALLVGPLESDRGPPPLMYVPEY